MPPRHSIKWYDFKEQPYSIFNGWVESYLESYAAKQAVGAAYNKWYAKQPDTGAGGTGGTGSNRPNVTPSPTPSATPSPSGLPTPSPLASPSPNASALPSASPLPSPSPNASALPSASPLPSPSPNASALPSASPLPSASASPTPLPPPPPISADGDTSIFGFDFAYDAASAILQSILEKFSSGWKGAGLRLATNAALSFLAKFFPGLNMYILSLFAARKISRAGFNYFLETSNTNYLALHASLIMTFEGKTELFGDFSNEENLTNNLGEQLMIILENGIKQTFDQSDEEFSDPDQTNFSKFVKLVYKAFKVLGSYVIKPVYLGLFNAVVPHQTFYVENTGRVRGTFESATNKIDLDSQLTSEISKYPTLAESYKPQKDIDILNLFERVLKRNQATAEFDAKKGPPYTDFFNKFMNKKNKDFEKLQNKIMVAIAFYNTLIAETEPDKTKDSPETIKTKAETRRVKTIKFLADNDDILLTLNIVKELQEREAASKGTASSSAVAKEAAVSALAAAKTALGGLVSAEDKDTAILTKLDAEKTKLQGLLEAANTALASKYATAEVAGLVRTRDKFDIQVKAAAAALAAAEVALATMTSAASGHDEAVTARDARLAEKTDLDRSLAEASTAVNTAVATETDAQRAAETALNTFNKKAETFKNAFGELERIIKAESLEKEIDDFKVTIEKLYSEQITELIGNKNFLLVDVNKLRANPPSETLINLNLPLSCMTEAMALFPSNYDKKIHDDLVAYNTNKNKFLESYRAKQKKSS
jgi:hypothetical protein